MALFSVMPQTHSAVHKLLSFKGASCRKCGYCCRSVDPRFKLRFPVLGDEPILREFKQKGFNIALKKLQRVRFFTRRRNKVFIVEAEKVPGGGCAFLVGGKCAVHAKKARVCKQLPFLVQQDARGKCVGICLESSCGLVREIVEKHWDSAPKEKQWVSSLDSGGCAGSGKKEAEVPVLRVSRAEIDGNPFLRDCFIAAEEIFFAINKKRFQRQESYPVVIESEFFPKRFMGSNASQKV